MECVLQVDGLNYPLVVTFEAKLRSGFQWLFLYYFRIVLEIKWWHIKRTHDGIKYVRT